MIEKTVESVPTRSPPTIEPETPVTEAAQSLRRPDVPALPVLEDGAVVGVVTESDVVAMVAETESRPTVDAIASPVETVSPAATLREAAETMRSTGVEHLPVVRDGVYGGMLSARTLAPYLSRHRLDVERRAEPAGVDSIEGQEFAAGD